MAWTMLSSLILLIAIATESVTTVTAIARFRRLLLLSGTGVSLMARA